MTPGQAIQSAAVGGRNVLAGPGIEYALDRDRYGRPVHDRMEEPGLLGFTGLMRVYMDNGVLPALVGGLRPGAGLIPGFGRFTPGLMAGATNMWRKIETADNFYRVINRDGNPDNVEVRTSTFGEKVASILGNPIRLPNKIRREIERRQVNPNLRPSAFGHRLNFGLDPNSPEGKEARRDLSEVEALRAVEKGYRFYAEVVDWRKNPDRREQIEGRWKRWMSGRRRLMVALRGLAVMGAYDKMHEALEVLESSGLLMEVFPPSEPVGRADPRKILGSRSR
jgi:hypothetical protein